MTPNLDLIAGVLCTLAAFALCVIHIISSARRGQWITLPEYVRVGLFVTAITLLYRGVNFITIAGAAEAGRPIVGRINAEGLIATAALTYTLCALALFLARKAYPEAMWGRIRVAERLARSKAALGLLYLCGFKVAPPGGGLHDDLDETPIEPRGRP